MTEITTEETDHESEAPSLDQLTGEGAPAPAQEQQEPPAAPPEAATPQEPVDPPTPLRKELARIGREKADLEREVQRLRQESQQRQGQPQHQAPPDPLEDPGAYTESINRTLQTFQLQQTLMISERFARQQHGETFEDARAWLSARPDVEQWAINQPDPWQAAITLYQREKLADEIGDNPDAWRTKERDRLRAELLAEMQGGAPAQQPGMAPQPAIPGAASKARSGSGGAGAYTGPKPLSELLPGR